MQTYPWLAKAFITMGLATVCTVSHAKKLTDHLSSDQVGIASYYSDKFHGRITASGERYDKNDLTTVHPDLPFGSVLRVTNLENDKSVDVRVNDRWKGSRKRLLDLSKRAAKQLGIVASGLAKVKIEVLSVGES